MGYLTRKNLKRARARARAREKSRRKTRVKKGGKFIYEGTYGCGFSKPPLKCIDEPSRRSNEYITKLVHKITSDEELLITPFLNNIDPDQRYFLYPESSCNLNTSNIEPENNINSCTGHNYDTLLISRNGGTDLSLIKIAYEDYIEFFASLSNIFDGLRLLHVNEYIHADIKDSNIVSIKKYPNTFHTRIIDFGLSTNTKLKNLRDSETAETFSSNYYCWPFELRYINTYKYAVRHASIAYDLKSWYEDMESYNAHNIPINSYWNKDGVRLFSSKDVFNIVNSIDYDNFPFDKVDVFSLGILLGKIYRKYIGHRILGKPDISNVGIYYTSTQEGLSQDEFERVKAWNESVFESITVPINNLIFDMIDINPNKRPDMSIAGVRYRQIVDVMRTLFTVDNLKNFCTVENMNIPEVVPVP